MIDATPALRLLAARRLASLTAMDPVAAQRATLRTLLRRAAATQFGREHGFAHIRSVAEYQSRVPLRHYEDFWRDYWQPAFPVLRDVTWPGRIPFFAQSSGTTGATTKRIPVSYGGVRANTGAGFDTMAFHLAVRPHSRVFGGRNLLLGGSTGLERLAPGVRAGDLSGIAAVQMPRWAQARAFPPAAVSVIGDWEAKMAAMAPASLTADVRSVSGTPSWMLLFFEQVAAQCGGRRLAEVFPNLELVVHGGVGFAPYRDQFASWLEGGHAELREVYPASEGFIATADRGSGDGLRLIVDRGLFFEFVRPAELNGATPDRRWLQTADLDTEYAIVLTSNSGLWSFVVGDTIRLTQRNPPRLFVTGRTAFTLSVFGEHLIAEELDRAVADAASAIGLHVGDYAAGGWLPEGVARGGHVFIVEAAQSVADAAGFARALDASLSRQNADYADHRRGDFGMAAPKVVFAAPGRFAEWMRSRGKLGGQNKVPRVINDPALLQDLLRFTGPKEWGGDVPRRPA